MLNTIEYAMRDDRCVFTYVFEMVQKERKKERKRQNVKFSSKTIGLDHIDWFTIIIDRRRYEKETSIDPVRVTRRYE